jgi:SAM-dependent MidA family methyltransferase
VMLEVLSDRIVESCGGWMMERSENVLLDELVELIRGAGPITFARYMELALYHPRHGFYTRGGGPWGVHRDFFTSVDAGAIFPGLLLLLFRAFWESLGSPDDYLLVDAGGGDGRFAQVVRAELDRGKPDSFSSAVRTALADRCAGGGDDRPSSIDRITFPPPAGQPLPGPCCVFANELLDALPVHLVRTNGGRLEEALVTEGSGRLALNWSKPTSAELAAYFERLDLHLCDGQPVAVNLEAGRWIRAAAAAMEQGHLVIIDYGYPAPVLFSPEIAAEPLRTFRGGREGRGPLDDSGLQDITSMVDFTSVARWAVDAGFTPHCLTDQYRLFQRLAEQLAGDRNAWERLTGGGAGDGPAERLRRGMALRALLSPEGIGGSFRVLVLSRGTRGSLPLLTGLRTPPGTGIRIE